MITGEQLAQWLSRLVQIPSVSPHQAGPRAGVTGEARIANAVAGWFAEYGGHVYRDEVMPGRPNIYAVWHGRSDRWIAVDVHMDTVGVEQMTGDPFSGRIADGRVYGRGAVDTKPTLAVVLALLEAMHTTRRLPASNLLVAATVDEEVGAQGAPAFARWVRANALAIDQLAVAEPTSCGPVYGHKGLSRLRFDIHGQAAHSSQPESGRNAITAAARLVLAMEEEAQRLLAQPPKTALGPARLTVSLIQGGTGINVVPDACHVSIDRRVVAGENPADVGAGLRALAERSCPLPLTATTLAEVDAFLQTPDAPWVCQLAEWAGRAPAVVPYCTNAWAYGGLAHECAVLGPGSIEQAHGAVEWVEIAELEKLAHMYTQWWGVEGF
ncbi:MAG: M20/M25/M40 family metallo-hydrolase [Chloroflexi bacterium]|nr:M20/M25/M40 family metallo-hydrolase [Chloroflexota bacterium]